MRKMLAIAVATFATLATLFLPMPSPASATTTEDVTFLLPDLVVSAAAPTSLCEPSTTGVVGRGTWTPMVTLQSVNHTALINLHAICLRGTRTESYDFRITADTNESCAEGLGTLQVTSGSDTGKIGAFTGSGTLVKVGPSYNLVFSIRPNADQSKSYDVVLSVNLDPADGTAGACNYGSIDLVGHGAIVYA